ncbi:MAG: L,D-transpeptidase [Thermoflexales bacterium]|nr:L,D-transpeptidase [Thermoflexales bacterium]
MANLSRRDFLKLAGAAVVAPIEIGWPEEPEPVHPTGLGRVTAGSIWAYDEPEPGARHLESLRQDTLLPIRKLAVSEGLLPHNPVWNLTPHGWVYSSWVQPVRHRLNEPIRYVPEGGFWGQVTVPYLDMYARPDESSRRLYRLYYSTVHLVIACVEDKLGHLWYQLQDDQSPRRAEFVPAEGVRLVTFEEMAPISPYEADKLIEVSLSYQMLYAYESGRLVFSARCATGTSFRVSGLGLLNYHTPRGQHQVIRKRPSRHMSGVPGRSDFYDLPGVPFCTYFTGSGVAIHGTYWHNDFGHPRSHGCVNVLAEEAQWVYRWVQPPAAYTDVVLEVREGGTQVIVT